MKSCFFSTDDKTDMRRHEKVPHEPQITSKQQTFGDPKSMLEFGVLKGFIPAEYANYRQSMLATFDIECLETEYLGKKEGIDANIEKRQNLVSIAVGSNIPGGKPKFFCRTSSDADAEEELVNEFVEYLEVLAEKYIQHLPE